MSEIQGVKNTQVSASWKSIALCSGCISKLKSTNMPQINLFLSGVPFHPKKKSTPCCLRFCNPTTTPVYFSCNLLLFHCLLFSNSATCFITFSQPCLQCGRHQLEACPHLVEILSQRCQSATTPPSWCPQTSSACSWCLESQHLTTKHLLQKSQLDAKLQWCLRYYHPWCSSCVQATSSSRDPATLEGNQRCCSTTASLLVSLDFETPNQFVIIPALKYYKKDQQQQVSQNNCHQCPLTTNYQ